MITIETILRKIANTLFINVQNMEQYGLLSGKLGVALFFFHYARYSNQPSYREFADEYLDFVCDNLNLSTPKDFANGLTGYAWTIQHVIENRFIEADDDFFEEVDTQIGKMGTSDFLIEIDDEIPLFSKGIYFTARNKAPYIKETLFQLEEFLEISDLVLPMSYLNSILFFLIKAFHSDIETAVCVKIFNMLVQRVKPVVEQKMFVDCDLVTFLNNSQKIKGINGVKNQYLIDNEISVSQETIYKSGWSSLIYKYQNLQQIKIDEINEYVDETIQNLRERDIPLYNGLTGLGVELMSIK